MKVVALNGSARKDGNTAILLNWVLDELRAENIETEMIQLAGERIAGCIACLGFARAVGEMVQQGVVPDVIVHATSSGGTQAGLVAGCTLHGLPTRVLGISADDPAGLIRATVRAVIAGMGGLLGVDGAEVADALAIEVDDGHVGGGYGVPSEASREAVDLMARHEALFVDHTYTAKALAGLIHHVRRGSFAAGETVIFWPTGGQVGLFA